MFVFDGLFRDIKMYLQGKNENENSTKIVNIIIIVSFVVWYTLVRLVYKKQEDDERIIITITITMIIIIYYNQS